MDGSAKHIAARIGAAEIRRDPFPHLIVPEIFPRDLYAEIQRAAPSWDGLSLMPSASSNFSRFEFGPTPESGPHAADWNTRYYHAIARLNEALLHKFRPIIDRHLRRIAGLGMVACPRRVPDSYFETGQTSFCHMRSGWSIEPHTHSMAELVQSMIYFPTSDRDPGLGTVLYRLNEHRTLPRAAPDDAYSFQENVLSEVARAPFRHNLLFAFVNTPLAVHGVVPVDDSPDRRYIFTKLVMPVAALVAGLPGHYTTEEFADRPRASIRMGAACRRLISYRTRPR